MAPRTAASALQSASPSRLWRVSQYLPSVRPAPFFASKRKGAGSGTLIHSACLAAFEFILKSTTRGSSEALSGLPSASPRTSSLKRTCGVRAASNRSTPDATIGPPGTTDVDGDTPMLGEKNCACDTAGETSPVATDFTAPTDPSA